MPHSILPWHRDSRFQKARHYRAARRRRLGFEALVDRRVLSAATDILGYDDSMLQPSNDECGADAIRGIVFHDINGNDQQDEGEEPIEGATVELLFFDVEAGLVVLITHTDENGRFQFDFVPSEFFDITVNATDYREVSIVSGEGGEASCLSIGMFIPASIGNLVWEDINGNGLQDDNEPGLKNVGVTLTGTDGRDKPVNLTKTTDMHGEYWFKDLAPGIYTITFTAPPGYAFTLQDADGEGLLGEHNSDAHPVTGSTPELTLRSGDTANYVDAGLYVLSVAGTVYIDSNDNAQQDPGEWGIPGVYVQLLGTDDLGDQVDAWVRTDADGNFRFTYMHTGEYTLKQLHPEEFIDGQDTVGSLGGMIPESDVITGIVVGPADVGTGYLFGELGLKYPSKQLLLTTDPRSLILVREPGSGVKEVNRVTPQEQTLALTVDRLDVNRDGFVTPADALFVINQVNHGFSAHGSYRPATQADVSGDGRVTALDALLVINYLNLAEQQQGEDEYSEAEGESWRFHDHAPSTPWEDDSNREGHLRCTPWNEREETEDWNGWRIWHQGVDDDPVKIRNFDDRAPDDARLGEIISILASDDTRLITEPLE